MENWAINSLKDTPIGTKPAVNSAQCFIREICLLVDTVFAVTIFPRPTASARVLSYLVYGHQSHRKSFHCHVLLYRTAYSRFIRTLSSPDSTQRRDYIEREREPETFLRWSVVTFKKETKAATSSMEIYRFEDDREFLFEIKTEHCPEASSDKRIICFKKNDSFRISKRNLAVINTFCR